VPPLRARVSHIPKLADRILRRAAERLERPFRGLDELAIAALTGHSWRGNVRELVQVIEHAVVVGRPPRVRAEDLALGA
jgi:DNA-binding NtrC family response regulator